MVFKVRRFGSMVVAMAVLLAILGACGANNGADVRDGISGSPEDRFKSFLNDYNAALNDPKIADPDTKKAWMERLAQYYLPDDRDTVKVGFEGTLGMIPTTIENVTTEKVSEVGDSAEVRITGGTMIIGKPGDQPPMDLAKEVSPFTFSGNPKLKKIDGVWYIDFVPR